MKIQLEDFHIINPFNDIRLINTVGEIKMQKQLLKYYFLGAFIYIVLYYLMIFLKIKSCLDIIPVIGIFFSFIVMFYVYKKVKHPNTTWLLLSLAALVWSLSNAIWAIYDFLQLNPDSMRIFNILYLIPTMLIMLAAITYMKRFTSGMNAVQLIIDIITVSLTCFILFWFIILKGDISIFIKDIWNIILFAYIICDFMIINIISVCFMSLRKGKNNRSNYMASLGAVLYAIIDLAYSYMYFYNIYVPYSIIDAIYTLVFIIIAGGGLYVLSDKAPNRVSSQDFMAKNIGRKGKDVFLGLPIIFYILLRGFDLKIIGIFILILLIYKAISKYVQNAIKNEELLEREKNLNTLLEEKVYERTKEIMLKSKELQYLAEHDFVTNTYNARYLKNYLDKLISENDSSKEIVIFYIDVDRFKPINDIYGHDVGDKLLIELSNRFNSLCLNRGIVTRIGGDEFVIVCNHKLSAGEIESAASEIIDKCSRPALIENYKFNMAISIGIAIFPKDAQTRITLLKNADMAMYASKMEGGNRYSLFNSHMSAAIFEKHEIELMLKNADYDNEFKLFYQPQIDIGTNKLIGMEALLRWNSPSKGNIPPNKFIKIAEEIGCTEKIGEFVINTAALQIGKWNRKYKQNLKVGINVSPKQLDNLNFAKKMNEIIIKYDLKASWIDVEVTENIAMKGETTLEEIFTTLDNIGISTSIDDFGTGYSSLSYIQQFSFNRIKIAKELVDDITEDLNKRHIVKAIITMAEALNVITIAEGIETEDQLKIVKELGCNEVQGYFYSKPIAAEEFEKKFLENSSYI